MCQKGGARVLAHLDVNESEVFDILDDTHFARLKQRARTGGVTWLHCAPPCKSCSRARRDDHWGRVPSLRSNAHPDGLPQLAPALWAKVKEANLIFERMVKIIRVVARGGGWWSVENPARSFIWQTKHVKKLFDLPRAEFYVGDQCVFGGKWRKATGWLSSCRAFDVLAVDCPGGDTHRHPPLDEEGQAPIRGGGVAHRVGCVIP